MKGPMRDRSLAFGLFLICGIWLTGLGLYFMLIRPALLPEAPALLWIAGLAALFVWV